MGYDPLLNFVRSASMSFRTGPKYMGGNKFKLGSCSPHIENVTWVMVATSTPVAYHKSRRLIWLTFVDDEAKEGNA